MQMLIMLSAVVLAQEAEWGGFRGNNGTGIAVSKQLPDALDPEQSLVWRTEVPPGYSSPIVCRESVLLTAAAGEKLATICLERSTGEVRWKRELDFDGERRGAGSPAAPSPATDGERVYAVFGGFGIVAYDLAGKQLWSKALGPFEIEHGLSSSPVLHEDLVVLQIDQDAAACLVAFDKRTGEQRWSAKRPGIVHGYSTPAVYAPETGPAELVVSGSFQISGYSVHTGEKLWWVDGAAWQTKGVSLVVGDLCVVNAYMAAPGIPRVEQPWEPLLRQLDADKDGKLSRSEWKRKSLQKIWSALDQDGDDLLGEADWIHARAVSRQNGALYAIRLGGRGDVSSSRVQWKLEQPRGLPDVASPIAYGDVLFLIKDGGLLTSLDLVTGKVFRQGRIGMADKIYASPVAAAGKLIIAGHSGELAVIRAVRDWEVVSLRDLGEAVWATPAIAGGQVFVRSEAALYCFQ